MRMCGFGMQIQLMNSLIRMLLVFANNSAELATWVNTCIRSFKAENK